MASKNKLPKIRYDSQGRIIIPRRYRLLKETETFRKGDIYALSNRAKFDNMAVQKIAEKFMKTWGGAVVKKDFRFSGITYCTKRK